MRIVTKSSEETKKFARDLIENLVSDSYSLSEARSLMRNSSHPLKGGSNNNVYNNVLCLYGDLGAGKTTFTQGLAEYLGISRIISPSFVLMRSYQLTVNRKQITKIKTLYHIDLYRLDNIAEIKNIGIEEIINNKNNLVVIEWAEKMKELLPQKRLDAYFKYLSDEEREIKIISPSILSFRA